MTLNAGDNEKAIAGTSVVVPPSVIVADPSNNPVSGVTVTFAVASGGGSVAGGTAISDASGIAKPTSWTLGATGGPNTVVATSSAIAGTVTFHAIGLFHPAGASGTAQLLTGRPYGVAISDSGVIYVGRQDADSVSPSPLSAFSFTHAVAVGADPGDVTFAPGGATGYVANFNSANVGIINVGSNTETDSIAVGSPPYAVRVSRDGVTLYVSTQSSGLQRYNTSTKASIGTILTNGQGNGLAFDSSGGLLYQSSILGQTVQAVNTSTGAIVSTINVSAKPQSIAVSLDGTELWVSDEISGVQLYSLPSGTLVATVPSTVGAFGLAMTPDGTQLYATLPSVGTIKIIDRATRTVVNTITGSVPRRVAFSIDGLHAVVADEGVGAILIN